MSTLERNLFWKERCGGWVWERLLYSIKNVLKIPKKKLSKAKPSLDQLDTNVIEAKT